MIELLIGLIIAVVVFFIVKLVVAELGFSGNILRIIYAVMGLIFLLWLLNFLGVYHFPLR